MASTLAPLAARRIESIDVFRGLTMAVMIFVNDLSGVKGLPWWTYHMPPGKDGMTYVDMVFPAFLFIVGMSLPLAVERRLEKGDSMLRLWGHILARSLGLIVLGILLANWSNLDSGFISGGAWMVLGLVGAILFWNVYPRTGPQALFKGLKAAGLLTMIALFAMFRRRTPAGAAWLDFSYWEILGLIGRAYLASAIVYIPLRRKRWAPFALLAFFIAMNAAGHLGWLTFLRHIPYWAWPFDAGEFPSLIMAGAACSAIFLDKRIAATFREKTFWALGFAIALFVAGWALRPMGLSKLGATPSWCLWCSFSSVLIFLALYWICDIRRHTKWAVLLKPAGANTLLTYLLPDIWYGAIGGIGLGALTASGWPGVVKSAVFVVIILSASAVLTRLKIRLQL
jgi:predicted acyltransferase